MFTELIARRFTRHHDQLLAYLDGLEQASQELERLKDPRDSFLRQREFFSDFLNFMVFFEEQHEREEERVLIPVLRARLESCSCGPEAEILEEISREHRRGRELLKETNQEFERLQTNPPSSPHDCNRFNELMQEIVSHFRNHIRTEDSLILPAALNLISDQEDALWIQSEANSRSEGLNT